MPAAVEEAVNPPKPDQEAECDEIFNTQEEMTTALSRLCYGDLYLMGKIWISVLRTVLVGAKLCLIPTVNASIQAAAVIDKGPDKPRKMRASELPFYDGPHKAYKDHLEEQSRCPEYDKKLVHSMIQPHVKRCRKVVQKFLRSTSEQAVHKYSELRGKAVDARNRFIMYMRDPENLDIRRGVVAASAGLGCFIGSGRGIPTKIIWTGFGTATAGMLCFPKETDEYIKTFCYHTSKFLTFSYNNMCNKNIDMEEVVTCSKDLPKIPPEVKSKCPPKP